jgi:hypothetical protein
MSQLAASNGQPGNWEEPGFFLRRLEIARSQEEGWQEPCESRGSRTVLRGTGGEIPPVYPTHRLDHKKSRPKIISAPYLLGREMSVKAATLVGAMRVNH